VLREDKLQTVSQAFGTTPGLMLDVARLRFEPGRYLTQKPTSTTGAGRVIGAEVAKEFFPLEDPIGKTSASTSKSLQVSSACSPRSGFPAARALASSDATSTSTSTSP
jgi:hypothetical protein